MSPTLPGLALVAGVYRPRRRLPSEPLPTGRGLRGVRQGRTSAWRSGIWPAGADLNPAATFPLPLLSCPGIPRATFTPSPTPQLNRRLCPRRGPGANRGSALATEAPVAQQTQ